jgi:hypothetical protein
MLPQAVLQIAGIGIGQIVGQIGKDHEGRWPGLGLGHVAQADAPAMLAQGRRVAFGHIFQPAVQAGGGDTLLPVLIDLRDHGHQFLHATAGQS